MSLLQGKSKLSQSEIDALGTSIVTGTSVFNETTNKYQIYVDNAWKNVSFDGPVYWIGHKNTQQTTSGWEPIHSFVEDKTSENTGSWVYPTDATNDYWQVPENGLYHVDIDCSFTGSSVNMGWGVNLSAFNNDTIVYGANDDASTIRNITAATIYLTTTDKLRFLVFSNTVPYLTSDAYRLDCCIYLVK